jgi:hypothetical protein
MNLAESYAFEKENPTKTDLRMAKQYYQRAKKVFDEYFELNPSMSEPYGRDRLLSFEARILLQN